MKPKEGSRDNYVLRETIEASIRKITEKRLLALLKFFPDIMSTEKARTYLNNPSNFDKVRRLCPEIAKPLVRDIRFNTAQICDDETRDRLGMEDHPAYLEYIDSGNVYSGTPEAEEEARLLHMAKDDFLVRKEISDIRAFAFWYLLLTEESLIEELKAKLPMFFVDKFMELGESIPDELKFLAMRIKKDGVLTGINISDLEKSLADFFIGGLTDQMTHDGIHPKLAERVITTEVEKGAKEFERVQAERKRKEIEELPQLWSMRNEIVDSLL